MWRSKKEEQVTLLGVGHMLSEALKNVSVRHEVKHQVSYDPMPKPTQVFASIVNMNGERWMVAPMVLYRDQRHIRLNGFPLSFVSGRKEDQSIQIQGIELEFRYAP